MTTTADAPFEFIGGDVNHSGEIQIAFVIAGGDRLIVPGRKPRELSTLLILNPTLAWWLARFPRKRGCVNYFRVASGSSRGPSGAPGWIG